MKKTMAVFGLALGLLLPTVATASITFQYVTDQSSYTAAAGSTVDVQVYLQETDTGGTTLFGNSSVKGLQSFGIYSYQTSTSGTSAITGFTPVAPPFSAVNGGAGTQYPLTSPSEVSSSQGSFSNIPNHNALDFYGSTDNTSNPVPLISGTAGNGVYRIKVGDLFVTAGQTTNFSLTSLANSPGDNPNGGGPVTYSLPSGNAAYILDQNGQTSGAIGPVSYTGTQDPSTISNFTVAAVPEPSSVILCGLVCVGFGFAAYRRRRMNGSVEAIAAA